MVNGQYKYQVYQPNINQRYEYPNHINHSIGFLLTRNISELSTSSVWICGATGFGWRLARGIVAGAIQFTVLEGTKEALEGRK